MKMTQEDKELLLKDLCSRLPYGVKVQSYNDRYDIETIETLQEIDSGGYVSTIECETLKCIVKPYLFPLESMTEEQKLELITIKTYVSLNKNKEYLLFDWLNANHFDYRGLLEKGLAIDATGLNIY